MPAVTYTQFMDDVARAFEAGGVAVLVFGFALGLWRALLGLVRAASPDPYVGLRRSFGHTILLGLEVLIAADLIHTVAVEPTVTNVLTLALIVAIRTFLSFSVDVEVEGRLPWRRAGGTTGGPGPR